MHKTNVKWIICHCTGLGIRLCLTLYVSLELFIDVSDYGRNKTIR